MAITYPLTMPSGLNPSSASLTPNDIVSTAISPFTGQQQVQRFPGQFWVVTFDFPTLTAPQLALWSAFLARLKGPFGTFLFTDPTRLAPAGVATGTPIVNNPGATLTTNNTTSRGGFVLNFASTGNSETGVQVGQSVSGTNIAAGSVVSLFNATTVTLNYAVTGNVASSASIVFSGMSGDYLFSRGWTGNVTGILKAGDRIQVGTGSSTTYYMLTADAASDSNGYAALEVWPQVRQNPAPPYDGVSIITANPQVLLRLTKSVGWKLVPSNFGSFSVQAREAL